jgi:hypothetical protein
MSDILANKETYAKAQYNSAYNAVINKTRKGKGWKDMNL